MAKTAYLLIEAEPGLSFNVIRGLRDLAEVTGQWAVRHHSQG